MLIFQLGLQKGKYNDQSTHVRTSYWLIQVPQTRYRFCNTWSLFSICCFAVAYSSMMIHAWCYRVFPNVEMKVHDKLTCIVLYLQMLIFQQKHTYKLLTPSSTTNQIQILIPLLSIFSVYCCVLAWFLSVSCSSNTVQHILLTYRHSNEHCNLAFATGFIPMVTVITFVGLLAYLVHGCLLTEWLIWELTDIRCNIISPRSNQSKECCQSAH